MTAATTFASDDLIRRRSLYYHSWTLATLLAAGMTVLIWYLGFSELDVGPVIWTLAGSACVQFVLSGQTRLIANMGLQRATLISQLIGTAMMGLAWHEFGGLQQPVFPLFVLLPLLTGTLLLNFWYQQLAVLSLLLLLASGVLLSSDTNSFIQQRYGLGMASIHIPAWVPRSRTVFADVSTSPAYDLVTMSSLVVIVIAMGAVGRAMMGLCAREVERAGVLEGELGNMQRMNQDLISCSPRCEALVMSKTGHIIMSSQRFRDHYSANGSADVFLLDTIHFRYPDVIKHLLASGGEEIQPAKVGGRDVSLRLSAVLIGTGVTQTTTRLLIESADELGWRAALDSLQQPAFALDAHGNVALLNRSARAMFGAHVEGASAAELFDSGAHWWDIAPLDSARRLLERGDRQFLASIRRERIAESTGDLTCVHLHERAPSHAPAA